MYRFIIKKIKTRLVSSLLKTVNNKLNDNPLDSDALNNRAILNIGEDTLEQSLQDMNKAIKLNSQYHPLIHFSSSAAYLFRGYAHIKLKKKEISRKDFKEALFQDHENQDAKEALESKSLANTNIESLKYVKKIFPDYINKNYEKRIKVLEKLCSSEELNKNTTYDLSVYYFLSGRYEESLLYAKHSLNIEHNNGDTCLLVSIIYFQQKNYKLALSYINQALKIFQNTHHEYHINSSIQYYNRGFIYYNMNELDLACNDLTKSLDLYKKNIDSLLLRAKIYIRKGLDREAMSDLKTATQYENNIEAKRLLKKLNSTIS
ncbi:MAG: tetratricopeptide repeat protein [Alphaproteobacteria bacterium]|nr:tetratricopeptide repeat protein [Alphaproteobacteria bacterium]